MIAFSVKKYVDPKKPVNTFAQDMYCFDLHINITKPADEDRTNMFLFLCGTIALFSWTLGSIIRLYHKPTKSIVP